MGLTVNITAEGTDSAYISADFTGGDPDYQGNRRLNVDFYLNGGIYAQDQLLSWEGSGPNGTFRGMTYFPGEELVLAWIATLQYNDADGWHDTTYSAIGAVSMKRTGNVITWIYQDGWKVAQPLLYNDGWR